MLVSILFIIWTMKRDDSIENREERQRPNGNLHYGGTGRVSDTQKRQETKSYTGAIDDYSLGTKRTFHFMIGVVKSPS